MITRRRKFAYAAFVTLAFFVGCEAVLFCFGLGNQDDAVDPLVGFSDQIPLLQNVSSSDGTSDVETSPKKLRWFNPQRFSRRKPNATRRVFCVGGSTTFGRPFDDPTSFCGWLREFLPAVEPDRTWEVINAGGISYASYRVAAVMQELAQYDPDIFIVYCGQNEFLEQRTYAGLMAMPQWSRSTAGWLQRFRTFRLLNQWTNPRNRADASELELLSPEVDERLNHTTGPSDYRWDPAWHEKVVADYRHHLGVMIGVARECGAEILFVMPASNEKDCSPFKSEPMRPLTSQQIDAAARSYQDAEIALSQQDYSRAWREVNRSMRIDPENPALLYQLGQVCFGEGNRVDAQLAFQNAIDRDVCPLRATSAIRSALQQVVDDENVALVDFPGKLRMQCEAEYGHACLGKEYFLDHVHPTVRAHRDLALWIIDEMLRRGYATGRSPEQVVIDAVTQRVEAAIDPMDQAMSLRNLAKVFHWSGKFRDAIRCGRRAIELRPQDLESRYLVADSLLSLGETNAATDAFAELFEIDEFDRAYLPYGELLHDQGRLAAAKAFLLPATMASQGNTRKSRAWYLLASTEFQLGELENALDSIARSEQIFPDHVPTSIAKSQILISLKRYQAARSILVDVLNQEPDNPDASALMQEIHDRSGKSTL